MTKTIQMSLNYTWYDPSHSRRQFLIWSIVSHQISQVFNLAKFQQYFTLVSKCTTWTWWHHI